MPVYLTSLVLFQVKHYLFDFLFQTAYQLRNKGTYGHPGGILHSGLHALGSIVPLMILSPPHWLLACVVGAEFLVHYHTDWVKEQVIKARGWTATDFGFWQALGIDQMIHHLTYIAMVAAVLLWAAQ